MPYKNTSDLSDSVKGALPQHAQEIFLAAYNNAWEQYKQPGSRQVVLPAKRRR